VENKNAKDSVNLIWRVVTQSSICPFSAEEPLMRLRKIHLNMMKTISPIKDFNKKVQYLITLCNSANKVSDADASFFIA
jgi:hypothetical protein